MSIQNPIARRLLPLALACGLFAALTPAVQAQGTEPSPELKGCGYLYVTISGTKAKVAKVTCEHGFFQKTDPANGGISSGQPAVVFLYQSGSRGPECTITLSGEKETAVLAVQQNYCGLAAGDITAKVVSGNAKLVRTVKGGFASTPGMAVFSLGF